VQRDVGTCRQNPPGRADGCDPLAAVQAALRRWVELRPDGNAKAVEAWREQLRGGSPFWRTAGSQLFDALSERFATVAEISGRMEAAAAPNPSETLRQWQTPSRAIRDRWPPATARDWESLIDDLSAQGNLLVDALVADTLSAVLRSNHLDRATRAELASLLQPSLAWSKTIALLPAPGRSWKADDYVLFCQDAEACAELDAAAAALIERLGGIRAELADLAPPSGDRRFLNELDAQYRSVLAAYDRLCGVMASGREGWPVEKAVLQAAVESFCSALVEFFRAARPLAAEHENEALKWASRLRTSCGRLCAQDAPASLQSTAREPTCTSSGSGGGDSMHHETPATWHGRIAAIVDQLRKVDDRAATALLPRLADLAAAWQAVESSSADGLRDDARRQLLGCLIMLDDRAERPPRPQWLDYMRQSLQAVLTEEGTYQIVGPELLGRDLTGKDSLAEVCGLIESKSVKPGGVARVQRLGYTMRSAEGCLVVLRKARVLLAK
jgi:hypothetical protein